MEASSSSSTFIGKSNHVEIEGLEPRLIAERLAMGLEDGIDKVDDETGPTATVTSSITNLANTILGSGMLAMPSAFASVGLLVGMFMVLFSGLASGLGLYLLSQCALRVNSRDTSFFAVSQLTYPSASLFFDLAIAIKCFGVSISYLVIIGDLMPQVMLYLGLESTSIFLDRRVWITISMILVIPLAFLKKLDSLKYTSIAALFSVGYLVLIVVCTFFFTDFTIDWSNIKLINLNFNFFTTLPIFVFGFTCHQNLFSIFNELKDNSSQNVNKVIQGSIFGGFLVYQLVGSLGYLSFGNGVKSNILAMYPLGPILTLGRIAVVFLALFSYPLQCHPCRQCLTKVLTHSNVKYHPINENNNDDNTLANNINTTTTTTTIINPNNNFLFNTITIVLITLSYTVAMLVQRLDLVLGFVGSTGSTAISFILPGLFYLKLTENQPDEVFDTQKPIFSLPTLRALAMALSIYGSLVLVICLSANIYKLFS